MMPGGIVNTSGIKLAITSEQVRAARALLRWEQRHLAEASSVSLPSIKRLETQTGALAAQGRTADAIRNAFESAGIEFIEENGGGPGVRLRRGKASADHPNPKGPATDVVRTMDEAITRDRQSKRAATETAKASTRTSRPGSKK